MTSSKRLEYTHDDRLKILKYIIKQKKYLSLRGNAFWIQMEENGVLPRTWQSMKQHFRTKIIQTIHTFNLPEEEINRIIKGYNSTSLYGKNKTEIKKKNNVPSKEFSNNFSDETDEDISPQSTSKEKICTPSTSQQVDNNENEIVVISTPSSTSSPDLFAMNIDEDNVQGKEIDLDESSSSNRSNEKEINLMKNIPTIVYSDSDNDVTIVSVDYNRAPEFEIVSKIEEFSREEDIELLNFMKKDAKFLKNRNKSFVYQFYIEINQSIRSCETLKDRFNNHILPNLQSYGLTRNEMLQICEDTGLEIPSTLKIEESKDSPTNTDNVQNSPVIKKDAETQNCDHEIAKDTVHYIHTTLKLQNELHVFVTDAKEDINVGMLLNRLASKYCVDRKNVHYVDLNVFHFLETMNKQKCSIQKQFVMTLEDILGNNSKEMNQDKLNILLKTLQDFIDLIPEVESSDEDSEIVNTQNFIPKTNSTPEKIRNNSDMEVESICISTDYSKTSEEILIHPEIKTNITVDDINEEKLSSLKSDSMQNIANIFSDPYETNSSLDFLSSESFHTALSQDIDK